MDPRGLDARGRELTSASPSIAVVGSGYVVYLAYRVADIGSVEQSEMAKPLSFVQAIAFQYVNPESSVTPSTISAWARPPIRSRASTTSTS